MMHTLLAVLLLFPCVSRTLPLGSPQEPPGDPVPAAQEEQADDPADPEQAYRALRELYLAALAAYGNEARSLRDARVPEDRWPPHPAPDWYERFAELAAAGSISADGWIFENAVVITKDPQERQKLAAISLRRMTDRQAGWDHVRPLLPLVAPGRGLVSEELALELFAAWSQHSDPELAARALFEQAMLMSSQLTTEDEGVLEEAFDLLRTAVDGYAGTEGSRYAGDRLFNRVLARMWQVLGDWSRQTRIQAESGVPPEEWSAFPLGTFRGEISSIARVGHATADAWFSTHLPAVDHALRNRYESGLLEFAHLLSRHFPSGRTVIMDVKFDILHILVEVWPDEPLILDLTENLTLEALHFRPERYRPLVERILERTSDERARAQALLALGNCLQRSNREAELLEARDAFARAEQQAPMGHMRREAEEFRTALELLLPGSPGPEFKMRDSEGFQFSNDDYRGKVVLMAFWGFSYRDNLPLIPELNRLHEHFEGRPFRVLGLNRDLVTSQGFHQQAAEHGIAWRNALIGRQPNRLILELQVTTHPLLVLLDSEGIIRLRGFPEGDVLERIEPWVQEAERAVRKEQAGTGDEGER